MFVILIVILSILLQLVAAFMALRLIKVTGNQWSWVFIAVAMALQASRRVLMLRGLINGQILASDVQTSEIVGLVLSALMAVGVVCIEPFFMAEARSIAERKIAEQALHESEARYRQLHESMIDCFAQISISGEIIDVNRSFLDMLGYTEGEIKKKRAKDLTPAKWHEFEQNIIDTQVMARDYSDVYEKEYIRKDGTIIPVELRMYLLRSTDGKPSGMWAIIRDITQRKQAEEELNKHRLHLEELVNERTREMRLAKEEAERANMAKTNFLHTMSHELRTPLNAILGFSEMLKQKTAGELNEKQERFIDNIQTGGKNLNNIVSLILEIVKIDEGTLELHIDKIAVPETVDEVISFIKEKAAKKNVLIEKYLDPELQYIEVDKDKISQVFINLLDNAVKFSEQEGGTVTISAKKEGDMARFSVSDTGIGIKEEDMANLFQNFTQLDSGTSRKYGGSGIGLAITKKLVELHGGAITVESRYGEGSTFTFSMPLIAKIRRNDK